MNWTAATVALIASAAAGFYAAAVRVRRVRTLQMGLLLLQRLRLELAFSRAALPDMLSSLSAQEPFCSFAPLRLCVQALKSGESLPAAWQRAVDRMRPLLPVWAATRMAQLGFLLGATDLAGQQQAIDETVLELQQSLDGARRQSAGGASLCRISGLCVGCILFIMIL